MPGIGIGTIFAYEAISVADFDANDDDADDDDDAGGNNDDNNSDDAYLTLRPLNYVSTRKCSKTLCMQQKHTALSEGCIEPFAAIWMIASWRSGQCFGYSNELGV